MYRRVLLCWNLKKVVFVKPWEVELQKDIIDVDNIPSGHVLLKKLYSLISTGTELACLSGGASWFQFPAVLESALG
jgi:hypothetical protein